MQGLKTKILIILSFCMLSSSFLTLKSQSAYHQFIYEAYISGQTNKWRNVIYTIENSKSNLNTTQKIELVEYYYGYTAQLIGKKEYQTAEIIIPKAEKIMDEILLENKKNANVYSYKAAFLGFRISISKLKALYLNSECLANINKAIKIDPNNIQAMIDKGNMLVHTPALFGGDKIQSLKLFTKAIQQIESTNKITNNWLYLNTIKSLARNYEKIDRLQDAKRTYEKALRIEPNFLIVKQELYPQLIAKIKAQ